MICYRDRTFANHGDKKEECKQCNGSCHPYAILQREYFNAFAEWVCICPCHKEKEEVRRWHKPWCEFFRNDKKCDCGHPSLNEEKDECACSGKWPSLKNHTLEKCWTENVGIVTGRKDRIEGVVIVEPEDWRERFDKKFSDVLYHKPDLEAAKDFIQAEKDRSYAEGYLEGRKNAFGLDSRERLLEEGKRAALVSVIEKMDSMENTADVDEVFKHINAHSLVCWIQDALKDLTPDEEDI